MGDGRGGGHRLANQLPQLPSPLIAAEAQEYVDQVRGGEVKSLVPVTDLNRLTIDSKQLGVAPHHVAQLAHHLEDGGERALAPHSCPGQQQPPRNDSEHYQRDQKRPVHCPLMRLTDGFDGAVSRWRSEERKQECLSAVFGY